MYLERFGDTIDRLVWVDRRFHEERRSGKEMKKILGRNKGIVALLFEFLISRGCCDRSNSESIVEKKVYLDLKDHSIDKEQHLNDENDRELLKQMRISPVNEKSSECSNNFFRSSKFSFPIIGVKVL